MTIAAIQPRQSTFLAAPAVLPTVWGLNPIQLHDYYWAARGVQVFRLGEPSSVVDGAELFLLTDSCTLAVFRLRPLLDILSWNAPLVLFVRVQETVHLDYQERATVQPDGKLERYIRRYEHKEVFTARVAFTSDPDIARAWQSMHDKPQPWRQIRSQIPLSRRDTKSVRGTLYNHKDVESLGRLAKDLVKRWTKPSSVIQRISHLEGNVWIDRGASVSPESKFIGDVWVGAGRKILPNALVVGPAILWDDPDHRPSVDVVQWRELEPTAINSPSSSLLPPSSISRISKRMFDILFALVVILLTLPFYPFVILGILLEDGWPIFFTHDRETIRGRIFPCVKFRSMRKDAETIKASLADRNQADGPQFFIENDPRLTRIGRFIRKTNVDELPQFFNVLLGHMSVVGPRPSPRRENQFCPAWREARLSVRPGITGLWQVNRTRIRGADFQEWIKYDIEYVERQSWRLDFQIIWKTFRVILQGFTTP